MHLETLEGVSVVVTGGSRGLGLGVVEALVERKARVTVLARDMARLESVRQRLGVDIVQGDVTDRALAERVLTEVRPRVLVLNAGVVPRVAPLLEQSWESFSAPWETDVKATFHWTQTALSLPLPAGARVLIGSSGAGIGGSPLSGGYAGAKRMQWFLASYLNGVSDERGLGLKFQALLPQQLVGETDIGRAAAEGYAARRGITPEAFLASFGTPMPPRRVGELVTELLTRPEHAKGTAFGLKGDGLRCLDA